MILSSSPDYAAILRPNAESRMQTTIRLPTAGKWSYTGNWPSWSSWGEYRSILNDREVVRTLSGIHLWPIDLNIALKSTQLDFSGDPADELIAATSVVQKIPLLTRDRAILRSRIVPFA